MPAGYPFSRPRWRPFFSVLLAGCSSFRPLLSDVRFAPTTISPNADGDDDVALIRYTIGRTANVSIYFVGAGGARHYFRSAQRRSPGEYSVYWGGVSNDPQCGRDRRRRPVGREPGAARRRLHLGDRGGGRSRASARQFEGQVESAGRRYANLPELHELHRDAAGVPPNQDGLRDDWVSISYYLTKKAERVQVYLTAAASDDEPDPVKYPIAETRASARSRASRLPRVSL